MICELNDIKKIEELNHFFVEKCHYYLIENFSIVSISHQDSSVSCPAVFDYYPLRWKQRYCEKNYFQIDPVFQITHLSKQPLSWHIEKIQNTDENQKEMLKEAYEYGIVKGITIPLLTKHFQNYVTFLNLVHLHPEILSTFQHLVSFYLKFYMKEQLVQKMRSLTKKELLVLNLKSQGKATKIVAHELCLSEATILFHLKNCREKLNCSTTEQVLYNLGLYVGLFEEYDLL